MNYKNLLLSARVLFREPKTQSAPRPSFLKFNKEIGERFNVRDTAISETSRRLIKKLEADRELRGMVEKIKGKLSNM